MQQSSQPQTWQYGDQVRHPKRPEWGVGTVTAVRAATRAGGGDSISVRFANAGLKTLNLDFVRLEPADQVDAAGGHGSAGEDSMNIWDEAHEEGWLRGVAEQRIQERMATLPEDARDPFCSVRERLERTARLFRFDGSARSLVDWAVMQTGLDDPLSRFSRQELEQHFERWAQERDRHFRLLHDEARKAGVDPAAVLRELPSALQDVVARRQRER